MSGPRVYDGNTWSDVTDKTSEHTGSEGPVQPVTNGDGTVFVSIVSFRDGKRCAMTLKSLFDNAVNPDKVVVGLVEQSAPEDTFCIEEYCSYYGTQPMLKRRTIRADMIKVMFDEAFQPTSCPHYNQIRLMAIHNIASKGPSDARALVRKVLGNEEFCMQIDSHTIFAKSWDEIVKKDWIAARNEFGIISYVPAATVDQKEYEPHGGPKATEVPRQCKIELTGQGNIPNFPAPATGKAVDLQTPLLTHTWSSAFSFAKCHLEESAPYDPFAPYIMGAEPFVRMARFWTRGYDVYTPTRNIVFHDYEPNTDGHGKNEWMKPRFERLRKQSLRRFQTVLQMKNGGEDETDKAQANLGLYGVGKRRTMNQMQQFFGIDLLKQRGNRKHNKCSDHLWVPYDTSISPVENLFNNPDNLDPQPEYPLRTKHIYYNQEVMVAEPLPLDADAVRMAAAALEMPEPPSAAATIGKNNDYPHDGNSTTGAPTTALFFLWIIGLIMWCMVYVVDPMTNTNSSKKRRKKKHPTQSPSAKEM